MADGRAAPGDRCRHPRLPLEHSGIFDEKITEAAYETKPSWYVVADKDGMIAPDAQRAMAKAINARTTEVSASHVLMVSQPDAVAAVILDAAASK